MRDQRGQVLPLALGLLILLLAVTGVMFDMTRVFLARRTLQNAADAAALSASNSLDEEELYASAGRSVHLDPARARRSALELLTQRGVDAEVMLSVDPTGVEVNLRSEIPTTFLSLVGIGSLPVAVEAGGIPVEGVP